MTWNPNPHFGWPNAFALAIVLVVSLMAFLGMGQARSLVTGLDASKKLTNDQKAEMCKHVGMSAHFVHIAAIVAFVITGFMLGALKQYSYGGKGIVEGVFDGVQTAVNLYLLVALSHTKDMAYQKFVCPAIIDQYENKGQTQPASGT